MSKCFYCEDVKKKAKCECTTIIIAAYEDLTFKRKNYKLMHNLKNKKLLKEYKKNKELAIPEIKSLDKKTFIYPLNDTITLKY